MNPNTARLLAAAGGGALIGSVATFFVTRYFVKAKWQEIADEEIASVKESYRLLREDPSKLITDEQLAAIEAEAESDRVNGVTRDQFGEIVNREIKGGMDFDPDYAKTQSDEDLVAVTKKISELGYDQASEVIAEIQDRGLDTGEAADLVAKTTVRVQTETSIFDKALAEAPDGSPRDRSKPYVISLLELAQPEDDFIHYEHAELKYFAGDNILLDSKDEIVLDMEELVGIANLKRFGDMSEDPNMVVIRNERIHMTLEVVRFEVGYAESKGLNVDPTMEDTYKTQRRRLREFQD